MIPELKLIYCIALNWRDNPNKDAGITNTETINILLRYNEIHRAGKDILQEIVNDLIKKEEKSNEVG